MRHVRAYSKLDISLVFGGIQVQCSMAALRAILCVRWGGVMWKIS